MGLALTLPALGEDGGTSATTASNPTTCHCDEKKGCYCPQHGWVCDSQATCSQKWREHLTHCKAGAPATHGRPAATEAHPAVPGKNNEELNANIALLRASPTDRTLRLKVLRMVSMLKAPPVTPDEALKFEGRAEYAFKNAKSESDYADAAKEYDKALAVAPWIMADYCSKASSLEKAGQLAEAKDSFEWCAAASPDETGAVEARKRAAGVGYALERARRDSFEGRWCVEPCIGHGDIYIVISRSKDGSLAAAFEGSGTASDSFQPEGRHVNVRIADTIEAGGSFLYDLNLADDGETLSGYRTRMQGDIAGSPVEMSLRRAK